MRVKEQKDQGSRCRSRQCPMPLKVVATKQLLWHFVCIYRGCAPHVSVECSAQIQPLLVVRGSWQVQWTDWLAFRDKRVPESK